MKRLALSLATLLSLTAQAEVYRIVAPDGSITFTDQPGPGAEAVELPPIMTYTPPPRETKVEEQEPEALEALPYRHFSVAAPADESTIRDNQGNLSMRLRLEPPLQAGLGHRIQFVVDGVEQGEPTTSAAATFQNLDRGSHRLSAHILDAQGNVLETASPVTVFVHRASTLFPGRQ